MKPLLKWAGGKRWLVPILKPIWAPYADLTFVEPFTGGMSISLGLSPKKAILNDANIHLINFYQQVSKGLVIRSSLKNDSDFYYQQRDQFNHLIRKNRFKTQKAASLFYYLMKTGFNGLCRFNNTGEFNVPFGQYNKIVYKKNFHEHQEIFHTWDILHGDFDSLKLKGDEFLYVDPPYDVEFTKYCPKGFDWSDQLRLAEWLNQHQGPIVTSNQATKRILSLYKDLGFKVYTLNAPRTISCNGDRNPAIEMLALKHIETAELPDKLVTAN